jgi:hypothetical protein
VALSGRISCDALSTCGFVATSSLRKEWESSTVDLIASNVAANPFIAATKFSIASTVHTRLLTWL